MAKKIPVRNKQTGAVCWAYAVDAREQLLGKGGEQYEIIDPSDVKGGPPAPEPEATPEATPAPTPEVAADPVRVEPAPETEAQREMEAQAEESIRAGAVDDLE